MANRWNRTVTTLGLNLLANVTEENPINIVRMACASGSCPTDQMQAQTALTNYVMDIPITASSQVSSNVYRVEGSIDNTNIQTGFYMKQVGVFATLGDNQDEILFELIQVVDGDIGDRIPSNTESPGFLATQIVDLVFSTDINITIDIDSGDVAELREELKKAKRCEVLIAANDSNSKWKESADYICDGVDDNVQIVTAINDLPGKSGKIFLAPGTYIGDNLGGDNVSAGKISIEGIGETVINTNGCILNLKGGSFEFKNIVFAQTGGSPHQFIKIYDTCDSVTVKDCLFKTLSTNCAEHCFFVYENTSSPAAEGHILFYNIEGCKFNGSAGTTGKYLIDSLSDKLVLKIIGCYIDNNVYTALATGSSTKYLDLKCGSNTGIKALYYVGTEVIAAGTSQQYSDMVGVVTFDTDQYSYYIDILEINAPNSQYDCQCIVPWVHPNEGVIGFSMQTGNADVNVTISYRLVAVPI